MKLEDFVKQTLLDITNGVAGARKEAVLCIAPSFVDGKRIPDERQCVSFETAVTVSKEGGTSIEVLSFSAGGRLSSEHISKISFEVPVYFNVSNSEKKQ